MKKKSENGKKKVRTSKKISNMPVFTIQKITPERSKALLLKAGIKVSNEQSEKIMEFLYMLTEITLKEFFAQNENL